MQARIARLLLPLQPGRGIDDGFIAGVAEPGGSVNVWLLPSAPLAMISTVAPSTSGLPTRVSSLDRSWPTTTIFRRVESTPGAGSFTIAMPGYLLASGTVPLADGSAAIVYDPVALSATFPNLDVGGRLASEPGLADTVWVSFALDGMDGRLYADHVTLQGPDVHWPAR
jgi:hypothetical protein